MVLAGGKGSRLQPLTLERNKHLLCIGEKPLIFYAVEQLLKAEVKDILLLVDERYVSQFMEALKDGSHLGIRSLAYVWQPPEGKGIPSAIAQVRHFCQNGKIIVVCGDVIIENGINKAVADFMTQPEGARMTAIFTEDSAGFSLLETRSDRVLDIKLKDRIKHKEGLIDLGVYMYHSDVFEKIRQLFPSNRGETEIWDLNMIYAREGKLSCTVVDGWWSDVGNSLEDYYEANRRYSK